MNKTEIILAVIGGLITIALAWVKKDVGKLHVLINSNLQGWIALAVAEALQRGKAEGIEAERQRLELPPPNSDAAKAIEAGIAKGLAPTMTPADPFKVPQGKDPREAV